MPTLPLSSLYLFDPDSDAAIKADFGRGAGITRTKEKIKLHQPAKKNVGLVGGGQQQKITHHNGTLVIAETGGHKKTYYPNGNLDTIRHPDGSVFKYSQRHSGIKLWVKTKEGNTDHYVYENNEEWRTHRVFRDTGDVAYYRPNGRRDRLEDSGGKILRLYDIDGKEIRAEKPQKKIKGHRKANTNPTHK